MCPCGAYTGLCASTDAAGGDGGGLFCPSGRWQTLLMRVLVGVACVNLAGVCGGHDRERFLLDLYLRMRYGEEHRWQWFLTDSITCNRCKSINSGRWFSHGFFAL